MINKKRFEKSFLYFLLFTLLFPIIYFYSNFPLISKVYNFSGIIIFFIMFIILNKNKINVCLIFASLFFTYLILLTFYYNGETPTAVFYSIRALALCYLFDYGIKNDKFLFLNAIKLSLFVIVMANLVSMLVFPNGIYRDLYGATYWLLGNKNNFLLFVFPLLFVTLSFKSHSLFDIVCIIISFLTIFLSSSSTSIVFIFLVLFFLIFKNVFNNYKIFNIKNYVILFLFLFLLIAIFQNLKSFQFLIVNAFNKDITLTNRTSVWNSFISYIKLNPIFGYGIESNTLKFMRFGVYHAHNEIYEILYETGIIGFCLFLLFVSFPFKIAYKNRNNSIVKCQTFLIFCYMITMIVEFRNYYYFLFVFVILYNCKYLIEGDK